MKRPSRDPLTSRDVKRKKEDSIEKKKAPIASVFLGAQRDRPPVLFHAAPSARVCFCCAFFFFFFC